jgi:hypothetical protein
MLRNVLNACVIVMLLLQGVAQASVAVQPHSSSAHCADHNPDKTDCPCCGDSWLGMAAGCATSCATLVAMPEQSLVVPPAFPQTYQPHAAHWCAGPDYSPVTPPPIS